MRRPKYDNQILQFLRDNLPVSRKISKDPDFAQKILENLEVARVIVENPKVAQVLLENYSLADVLAHYPGFAPVYLDFLMRREVHLRWFLPEDVDRVPNFGDTTIWITFLTDSFSQNRLSVAIGMYRNTADELLSLLKQTGIAPAKWLRTQVYYADIELPLIKQDAGVSLTAETEGQYVLTLENLNFHLDEVGVGRLRTLLEEAMG